MSPIRHRQTSALTSASALITELEGIPLTYDFAAEMAYYQDVYQSVRKSLGLPADGYDTDHDPHHPGGHHNPQNQLLPAHTSGDHHTMAAVEAVRTHILHPPAGTDGDLSRFFALLGGRAAGYETQVPNLEPQVVAFLSGIDATGQAKELLNQWIAKLDSVSGHVRDATSVVDAPPDPQLPGQQRAPWTTCGKGWFGVAAGTFGIAAGIVGIIDSGGTLTPVATPFIATSANLVAASITVLGENGCSIGSFW